MADSPKDSESAQALFCAIADYVGINKLDEVLNLDEFPTYQSFTGYPLKKKNSKDVRKLTPEQVDNQTLINEAFSKLKVKPANLEGIEKFLDDKNSWYTSSVVIAKKLIREFTAELAPFDKIEASNWQDLFYVRGGSGDTTHDNIDKLFSIANKNDRTFGDVNKWSPADIYFVSELARTNIAAALAGADENFNFDSLNKLVNGLLAEGHLLPLSLKKAPKEAHIVKYNFVRKKEEEFFASIEYDYLISQGVRGLTSSGFPTNPAPTDFPLLKDVPKPLKTPARDLKIYFKSNSDAECNLKIRHDVGDGFGRSNAVKVEIEQKGAGGRLGSFVGIPTLAMLVKKVDKKFGQQLETKGTKALDTYWTLIQNLNRSYQIPLNENGSLIKTAKDLDEALKNARSSVNKIRGFDFPCHGVWYNIKTRPLKSNDKKFTLKIQESTWPSLPLPKTKDTTLGAHNGKNLYEEYKIKRARISAICFDNEVYPYIAKYFEDDKRVTHTKGFKGQSSFIKDLTIKNSTHMIAKFLEYASSRSAESGKFVIAK